MIQIKEIDFIPKLDYAVYSLEELKQAEGHLRPIEEKSRHIWVVLKENEPLVVAGVTRRTLLVAPRLWFLICRCVADGNMFWALRGLRQATEKLSQRYPKCEILVEEGWQRGLRFARFCGFHETPRSEEILGHRYVVMEN